MYRTPTHTHTHMVHLVSMFDDLNAIKYSFSQVKDAYTGSSYHQNLTLMMFIPVPAKNVLLPAVLMSETLRAILESSLSRDDRQGSASLLY